MKLTRARCANVYAIKNRKRNEDPIGRNKLQYTQKNSVGFSLHPFKDLSPSRHMKKTPTEWTVRIAAATSAGLEELIMELPSNSDIARDGRKLADKIDRRFDLVQLSIPVGD